MIKKRINPLIYSILIFIAFLLEHSNGPKLHLKSKQLDKIFRVADSLKFVNYEKTDSLLEIAKILIAENNNSPEKLAKFYFLKTHNCISKEDYSTAISYYDSTKQTLLLSPNYELSSRLYLTLGIINEMLGTYDKALEIYYESYDLLGNTNHNYEKLIALLGIARIQKLSKNNYKHYMSVADSIVKVNPALKTGLYWTHLAFFASNSKNRNNYYKKALEYYKRSGNTKKMISTYISIIADFLNAHQNDSAYSYLNTMNLDVGKDATYACFETSKARIHTLRSFYYARIGQLDNAIIEANYGIKHASANKQYYSLKLLYKLVSDVENDRGNYAKSQKFLEQANKFERKYHADLDNDKIRVADYKFLLKKASVEISTLKRNNRIKNLTFKILIILIFVSLLTTYIIYTERNKISNAFNEIRSRYKSEKLKTAKSIEVISSIEKTVKDNTKSYATIHKQVDRIIKEESDITTVSNSIFNDVELKKKIFQIFPGIIESQYKYIVCIHYGFDTKTTMKVLGIKKDALKSRKKRLAEKINVPKNKSLKDYISSRLK